ncbi:hypothetical protein GJ744_009712 [Endocarpon pusillum]|uniref:Uncharacterized protein n=1 Tax=Endocarpon pusillum TaxID=364733 RepID=A0A8H7AUK0_9EURO|nr:hypothetical protein GJ744_009712 [Endocarpon pusillum]
MKEILNPQLRLAEAINRLNTTIRQKLRALASKETESGLKLPRTLDRRAFTQLIGTISTYAMELIASDGQPIPRSLCHPRWWIFGPTIQFTKWKPSIYTTALPISPPRNQVTQSAQKLIDLRDSLQGEAKARVDQAILQANAQIAQLAEQVKKEAELPTKLPERVNKPGWRRNFKDHDKTTRRAMTAVEAMEKDEQRAEDEQRLEIASPGPLVPEDLLPPPSTAPAIVESSRKRTRKHTTAYRETFGDSQEDPSAGIKRGRAGGIL